MSRPERREEILDAVERILGRDGAHAVTMRAVAAEAGVSLRLVQYYGKDKAQLLTAALDRLADKSIRRWRERSAELSASRPGDALKAFFDEALPTDEASRAFHRVGVSLELLAITQPDVGATAYRNHLRALADHLAEVLSPAGAMDTAEFGRAAEPAQGARRTAVEAMSLAHGIGTLIMAGVVGETEAQELVRDYLHRMEEHRAD
ncbi:TetR/AcrR family transcriptional regulator [Streptomonospora wellingtoniae]|uniref:TetR family transcriptional regulator n=1 Tax=Streptomonospora wellingtoniae TaxID=3075544 RepID=A0ABU2KMZ5_9ACTN|nr:TetR family transcriptional regulator [Streptomonospora sp. DSM 45055]MDT0300627.1 TetR family transcriptional regulator [Streptomonospora sp. DSM 45055]